MIHNPKLPPLAGYVEIAGENGKRIYRPVSDRVSEVTEAVELVLSGDTGEEANNEADS